jgi:hypothetical protein
MANVAFLITFLFYVHRLRPYLTQRIVTHRDAKRHTPKHTVIET